MSHGGGGGGADINVLDEIKDPYIKAYIELSLEKGWIKSAKPGYLTVYEASKVTELNLNNIGGRKEVATLEGIKYFTGLERLSMNYTAVSLINLSQNVKLRYLGISECSAPSLKIISPFLDEIYGKYAGNVSIEIDAPRLREIDLSYSGKLNSLDVSACTNLKILKCGGCRLKTLDLANNQNLELLWCGASGNLSLGWLDVSRNRKLTSLSCDQGATAISKLYMWWSGGRDNIPVQLRGEDDFFVNARTEILKNK